MIVISRTINTAMPRISEIQFDDLILEVKPEIPYRSLEAEYKG